MRHRPHHRIVLLIVGLIGCGTPDDPPLTETGDTGAWTNGSTEDGSSGSEATSEVDTGTESDTSSTDDTGSTDTSDTSTTGPVEPPPYEPVYRIDTRIHVGDSELTESELVSILDEMNTIWWSQAGVCFEFEVVEDDETRPDGFDLWFLRDSDSRVDGVNGLYAGDHTIYTRDHPSLGDVDEPVMEPAARTAAHELGHGLNLGHTNTEADWGPDHRENLMASGTKGWHIPAVPPDPRDQVLTARERAEIKAIADLVPLECGAPVFP